MNDLLPLIKQTAQWCIEHRTAGRQIEAASAAIRLIALLDAYKAIGGDPSPWRKECGVLR